MRWNNWNRQLHRWASLVFTLAVVANFVSMIGEAPPEWIAYLPLPPLFLLLFTGLYLFVLPHVSRRRGRGLPTRSELTD